MSEPQRIEVVVRIVLEIQTPNTVASEPIPNGKPESPQRASDHHKTQNTVERVIGHYLTYHPQARPGTPVRTNIRKRLAEGFSEQQLIDAIDGCHKSPHHCGDNERQTKYQSIGLIFRDSDHVQQFIELNTPDGPVLSEKSRLGERAGDSFLEKFASPKPPEPKQIEVDEVPF